MPNLTLIEGDEERTFLEHPIEEARPTLLAAAELENEPLAGALRRTASALPDRPRTLVA